MVAVVNGRIPWGELWPFVAIRAIATVGLLVDRWRSWWVRR